MSEDPLHAIFAEGQPDWLSLLAREDCTEDEIVQLLDTQSYFDLLKLPYPATRDAVLDRFDREKLICRRDSLWCITRLGAILFAKRLDEFDGLGRNAPRVVVYSGPDKLATRLDKPGTKGYSVGFEGLLEFINEQVPSNEVIGQALRQEVKMFPPIAIRELVANALIHQDFTETGTSVTVELFLDRMEITSPGRPFISTDRSLDEYQSRNERLADLMRRLHICEEKGSGIDKVIAAAEAFQLPAPDFRANERHTISLLFAHKEFEDMDRSDPRSSLLSALLPAVRHEPEDVQSKPAGTVQAAGEPSQHRIPGDRGDCRSWRDQARHDELWGGLEAIFPIRPILGVSFHFSASPCTRPHLAETAGKPRTCLFHPKNGKPPKRRNATPELADAGSLRKWTASGFFISKCPAMTPLDP